MKSSIGSRSMKLLGLAAKVTKSELAQNIREQFTKGVDEIASGRLKTRVEQARLIAESLSQLKGAAMKAGQLISLDATDIFPPEAVEILSKLQGKAEPVDWSLVQSVLEEDLGQAKIDQFEKLSIVPAASASIGQVHKGRLGGIDVAVKIQYPGVADSIDSDLRILRTLAQSLIALGGKRVDLEETFEELARVLKQEADYELELAHMNEYRELLDADPETASHFAIPKPIESHCSPRVLTMTWQEGLTLNDWLETNPPIEMRERVGRSLLELYCKEFYDWGFVQTDPNYGNFLIQPDPLKLVVLDFGATLRYSREFRREYIQLLQAMATFDRNKVIEAFVTFGLIDARENDETKDLLVEMLTLSLEPFDKAKQPFRFKDDDYARRTREITRKFTQSLKYSPPPRKILFLHRKLGGVFTFLKKLDVQLDVTPYWEPMIRKQI